MNTEQTKPDLTEAKRWRQILRDNPGPQFWTTHGDEFNKWILTEDARLALSYIFETPNWFLE